MHVQRSELRAGRPSSIIMNFSTNALMTRIHLGHGEHLHFTNVCYVNVTIFRNTHKHALAFANRDHLD